MVCSNSCHYCSSFPCVSHILHTKTAIFILTQLKNIDIFNSILWYLCLNVDKLRLYDKKIGKFGFLKNGAGLGENAYQVRYGSLMKMLRPGKCKRTKFWKRKGLFFQKTRILDWQIHVEPWRFNCMWRFQLSNREI